MVQDLGGSRCRTQGVNVKVYPGCSVEGSFGVRSEFGSIQGVEFRVYSE